jgi:CCR4-NOT transcription complex subunit 4
VLQRNLLYVFGIANSVAKEETLRRKEYFGKYGKIVKIAVNRKQSPACAYVT